MRYYSSTAGATTLASSCSDTATTIELTATTGLPSQFPFTLVLDAGTMSEEIVTVTALSGTSAVVVRGEDGSGAQAHQTGAAVRHMASARDFREPQQHMAATVAHGVSSNLVGVSDTQTLSNKTLDTSTQVVVDGAPVALSTALSSAGEQVHSKTGSVYLSPAASNFILLTVPPLPNNQPFWLEGYVQVKLFTDDPSAYILVAGVEGVGAPSEFAVGNIFPLVAAKNPYGGADPVYVCAIRSLTPLTVASGNSFAQIQLYIPSAAHTATLVQAHVVQSPYTA